MKTSEYMDKEITGLTRSRSDDFIGNAGEDSDYDESHSPRFRFYPSQLQSSAHMGEIRSSFNEALLSLIDKKMKEHTDEVLHAVEGLSARLTQLESRARRMENSIDDVKEALNSHHGRADGKLRELENLLREVLNCTRDVRDKQDIAQAQIQLTKLSMSKATLQPKKAETARTESVQEAPSLVPQQSTQSLPVPVAPSQQTSTPPPHSFSHVAHPYLPLPLPPAAPFTSLQPDASYQMPPFPPRPLSTLLQPHQLAYQPPLIPPPLPNQVHQQTFVAAVPPPTQQASSSVHLEPNDFSHYSPRWSGKSTPFHPYSKPPEQPPNRPYMEAPEQPTNSPYSVFPPHPRMEYNFNSLYARDRGESPFLHSNSTVGSFEPMQPDIRSGYSQLPTARMLPQALPTVSITDPEPSSSQSSSKEPTDEVVDGVVAMGFRRDVVRATVKKLMDRGQPVDPNVVLDILTTDGQNQPPNARFY